MENLNTAGGAGPAPFLLKTYEMVDDSSTDDIVAWSSSNTSFIVWNPPEFARILLPTYFKHNNFSSFIRQLNTYGFRKIDPERWEFANEEFVKDQKHLLKNIHRRKPIHSHSQPQGSSVDSERAALEEQIDKLAREKASLESKVIGFEQQRSATKHQLEGLAERVKSMAQRQDTLFSFLEKAVQDPTFVEHLANKIESMDFSAYNKKRRIPQDDDYRPVMDGSFVDYQSASKLDFGNVLPDFSNKLTLELSPSSDINLVSRSTQSSTEDGASSPPGKLSEGEPKEAYTTRTAGLLFVPETLELSDTGASGTFIADSSLQRRLLGTEDSGHNLLAPNWMCNEGDDLMSCHLNLTLASSTLQIDRSPHVDQPPQPVLDIHTTPENRVTGSGKEHDMENQNRREGKDLSSSLKAKEGPPAAPVRVNDIFWEQFLTERPGATDNEEASSSYRAIPHDDHRDRSLSRNEKGTEQLSL